MLCFCHFFLFFRSSLNINYFPFLFILFGFLRFFFPFDTCVMCVCAVINITRNLYVVVVRGTGKKICFDWHEQLGLCTSIDPAHRRRTPDIILICFWRRRGRTNKKKSTPSVPIFFFALPEGGGGYEDPTPSCYTTQFSMQRTPILNPKS